MSKPQNILAKYRSYAYHHILIACDNEAAASYIRNSNRLSVFRDFNEARAVTIEEDKIVLLDTKDEATGRTTATAVGSYVIIINGMVDTSFVIKDVEWFTTTAASTDQHDRHTSIAVEGKMTVEEPRGMRFMNALNGACDLLETDPTGVIWMLKTIFVGHGIDSQGNEFSDHITDLRPLEYMMYDVTGTFDVTGGVYEISFAGANNGASRFPQFSRVSQNVSLCPADNKLSSCMVKLESEMNRLSEENRTCVIKALKETYEKEVDTTLLDELRLVKYRIILDDPYDDGGLYVVDRATDQEKSVATEAAPPVFKFGVQSTVEQAIRHIMDRTGRVLLDRTDGDEDDVKYSWKIHSEITMVGAGTKDPFKVYSDKSIVLVVYTIRRQAEMSNQTIQRVLDGGLAGENKIVTQQKIQDNLVTFDYFFTGKNTDIIDFDLKMEMGLAFLQTVASTNTIGTGTNQIQGTETNNARVATSTENSRGGDSGATADGEERRKIMIRNKTPIFPATNVNNIRGKNVGGALESTLFNAMLSRHAALESVEAIVTIHGNPYLMSQTNRRGSDSQLKGNSTGGDDPTTIMQNWESMPALAKINIFMPSTNATPSSTGTFNRERFWYDGYFYMYGIDHKFSDGLFTQNLHLLALPDESLLEREKKNNLSDICGVDETADGGSESDVADPQGAGTRVSEAVSANTKNGPKETSDVGTEPAA